MVAHREIPEVKAFEQQILDEVCQEIQSTLNFDFVGISLISRDRNTIEAIHGTGIAKTWVNRARHYLEADANLRDIQADIAATLRTEIIEGWDDRFDLWIYDTFQHQRLRRIFTPILLVQDSAGRSNPTWFEHFDWQTHFQPLTIDVEGNPTVIEIDRANLNTTFQAIGTIEAGYENTDKPIPYETAITLAKLIARRALDIQRARLPYVLETIAENARQILNADLTTLHFFWEPNRKRYIYEVRTGSLGIPTLLREVPPRPDGLGWQAIREGVPKYFPVSSSERLDSKQAPFDAPIYQEQYQEGSRAYAAFPLIIQPQSNQDANEVGVLYVHINRPGFEEETKKWGELFAERAIDAIWHAHTYQQMRDKARQLETLHSVAQSLSQIPENGDLLSHIAWNTLNALAADVVTIYAYVQTEQQFLTPPSIAGQLRAKESMESVLTEENVPFRLIQHGENLYAPQLQEEPIFRNSPFAARETVLSAAGILLKVDEDTVGVMFINYRRSHSFSIEERKIIDTLASSAANAIKSQRWLQTLGDIDHEIITTLDQETLLKLIVQRAVQITGGDLGVIRRLEPDSQELVALTHHPANEPVADAWTRIRFEEGVAGWVAQHRQSVLVNNVRHDERYKAYFANAYSELCVPLLDQNAGVLGVLSVESRRQGAFRQRDLYRLEVLADLAVLAIQNAESKEQLVKIGILNTVDDFAAQLLHQVRNDLGATLVHLQDSLDSIQAGDCESGVQFLQDGLSLLRQFAQNPSLNHLIGYRNGTPEPIDLSSAIADAIGMVRVTNTIRQEIQIEPEQFIVFSKVQTLTNIFYNLIRNALDAMPEGGTLSIHGMIDEEIDDWIVIEVCDTGIGISEEHKSKIFQQGFTTKKTQSNIGFGLWWTRNAVETLRGRLDVVSELGRGSKFIVILPAYRSIAE
jgi:signal transduction histidine kinase